MTLASTSDNPAPPGAIEEDVLTADGVRLRAVRWTPAGAARGTVALLGGRGEFIEKYFEMATDLLGRGFAVAAFDWRGQGGSDRPLRNARKGHVDDFSQFEGDLDAFVAAILEPHCPRPWFGLGHSMGAAILLLVDEAGRRPFDRLVLTSPMIAVKGVDHRGPARYVIGALDALGFGGAFAPGNGAETFWTRPFEGNVFTTDAARFARIAGLVANGAASLPRRPDHRLVSCRLPGDAAIRRSGLSPPRQYADPDRRLRRGSGDRHRRCGAIRRATEGRTHRGHRRRRARDPDRARRAARPVLGGVRRLRAGSRVARRGRGAE